MTSARQVGRNISLSVSRICMTRSRSLSCAGTKKGDGGPSPSHNGPPISWRPMSSAALFCRDLRRRSVRNHGYVGTTLETGLERHGAVAKREKRMVFAHADAFARIEFGAAL